MAKKLKLKKQIQKILILVLFLIIGFYASIKIYKNYQYKQTNEYKLINHGYTKKETLILLKNTTSSKEINYFLSNEVNQNYVNLTKEKYFIKKNYFIYIEYMLKNLKLTLPEVVRDVNTHLNQDFYSLNLTTNIEKDYLMLVNKHYLLDKEYIPEDLVAISQKYAWGKKNSKQIRQKTYEAFLEMWHAAETDGYYLMINSAYRSYSDQEEIYNNYKDKRGKKYADSIAARPGASEHQTGLAIDVFGLKNSNKNEFENTEEAKWLAQNAYKFGFILRYPKQKENITGYNFEPWHYRYVGTKVAKYCFENDITYEEYYAFFVETKEKNVSFK